MRQFSIFVLCAVASVLCLALPAEEPWQAALARMPISRETPLNRDNCLPLLLGSFRSNECIKALVVLPAVSDDFYLIHRDRQKLDIEAANLLTAITALTNATSLRATFKSSFLLLHLDRDSLEPSLIVTDKSTAEDCKARSHLPHALWIDLHWERLQPELHRSLKMDIRPAPQSMDAWHFARHNVAAWNLTDWELLEVLSLTGKTTVIVQKHRLLFQVRS